MIFELCGEKGDIAVAQTAVCLLPQTTGCGDTVPEKVKYGHDGNLR